MDTVPTILKTYRQWQLSGRAVRQGQRAAFYIVSDEGSQGRALFSEEQTELLADDVDPSWTRIIPASEWKKPARKPKLHVGTHGPYATIWCGSNKDVIKWLRGASWRWERSISRWVKPDIAAEHVATEFEKKDFDVIREWVDA